MGRGRLALSKPLGQPPPRVDDGDESIVFAPMNLEVLVVGGLRRALADLVAGVG